MALHKDRKNQIIDEVSDFITQSKMTVIAQYKGTSVQSLQQLRRDAKQSNTKIMVIKNRLFIKALQANPIFTNIDTAILNGMLLYVFNFEDEVAGAQTLAKFIVKQPTLEIIGAITNEGLYINQVDANTIASLPSQEVLRGLLVGVISAPLTNFVGVLSGNIRSLFSVLEARADSIG